MSSSAPVPSLDGKKLFVVGAQPRGELVRYDGKSGQFVPYLSGISAEHLNFSRDGEWVAYVTYPEATLWRSKVDGSQRLQLSFPPLRAILPRWSPGWEADRFHRQGCPGKPWKIYLVSAEGGTPHNCCPGSARNTTRLVAEWEFPGLRTSSVSEAGGGFGPVAIHRLDLKTRQVSTLPGSEGLWAPALVSRWTLRCCGGRRCAKVAAFRFHNPEVGGIGQQPYELYVLVTRWEVRLLRHPLVSDPAIFRVGISDRRLERVVSLKDFRREWGSWVPWFGLAPDDSPCCCGAPAARRSTPSTGKHREIGV